MLKRFMTRDEYNTNKFAIRHLLQAQGDAHVFRVLPGQFPQEVAWKAAAELIAKTKADGGHAQLVRGFVLIVWFAEGDAISYTAFPCPVVRIKPASDAPATHVSTYEAADVTSAPMVFVPSSRMHPELSDAQLLSSTLQLSHVWSVPPCEMPKIRAMRRTRCALERHKFCLSPEEAVGRRPMVVYMGFFLKEYMAHASSIPVTDHFDAHASFGFPFADPHDVEAHAYPLSLAAHADALVHPKPPWTHDRSAWLPSSGALHAATLAAGEARTDCELRAHMPLFFQLYKRLECEYLTRMLSCWHPKFDWKDAEPM